MDDTGYCDMQMIADWKLEAMAKMLFEQLWGERKETIQLACHILHEYYQQEPPKRTDNTAAIKTKIARIEGRLSNLIDMRTDGDISKAEYKERREKLDSELLEAQTELENTGKAVPIPQEAPLRWKEINHTLNEMIDISEPKVHPGIIEKFVSQITPKGNNRYEWHLKLDNGITDEFTAAVEGKKNNAVIFLDDEREDAEASSPIHTTRFSKMLKNRMKSGFLSDLLLVLHTAQSGLSCCKTCNPPKKFQVYHYIRRSCCV